MKIRTQDMIANSRRVPALLLATTLALAAMLAAALPARAQYYNDGLPGGNWRQFCTNSRMDGRELKAHCRNRNGILVYVEANIAACGGLVSYDVNQTKFFCGNQGGAGYGPGGLPAGEWRQYCTNARMDGNELKAHCRNRNGTMVYVEANIASCGGVVAYDVNQTKFYCGYQSGGFGSGSAGLPGGQWRQYCTNGFMQGNELKATCRRPDGSYRHTEANISECGGRDIDYIISTGRFQCAGFAGPGYNPGGGNAGFPPGSWSQTCTNASMQGPILRAQCRNNFGQLVYSQIDANQCYGGIWNNNGQLRCQ